ncbi:hypothetical protein F3I27_12605 [Pantoea sp. Bo_2]|uniref:hypothetical protein n=1 Tax=unclassified Pantoea TaxID=2630326 RepID=UPI001231FD79|nr:MULTISPECIES: hypothetical protein [unclassified Pantoea]KAA5936442.1 hypothetical protein F3I57_22600 [Pantoea sp. VH_3]KAA5949694.1 hypothetical protein F3I56_17585 [Pantoea sp. VH_25]KAA5955420.1 hypothetical protein F3I55_12645 [Pantoea sp. VH_24]KAA5958959.1 hypothetical protein F3I53_13605 [Pantoea sp. VH_16]KAA5964157.1 hypothetical protein F3I54_13445 [Pantoea sp. VH_18]
MEKLTDILGRTGKASTRELAAILKIDTTDALKMLRELQDEGAVCRDGSHWCLPVEQGSLPSEPESLPVQPEKLPVEPENLPVKQEILPGAAVADEVASAPLKVIWSAPEDFQPFPTPAWVCQQRRALQQEEREFNRIMKNKKRTLAQIENLVRRVARMQGGVAQLSSAIK